MHYLYVFFLLTSGMTALAQQKPESDSRFIFTVVDPQKQQVRFFYQDEHGEPYRSIQNLKQALEQQKTVLEFAMNGGMYMEDNSPLGLYIEEGKTIKRINRKSGTGNFYMQPNGVFYITQNRDAVICRSGDFKQKKSIRFATQSGPMLLVDGVIPPAFRQGSTNLNIRNGVGILPDHTILFVMSKKAVNFYDFADYFKRMGCCQALYLDGFVSRTYLPAKNWIQTDGDFGVLIGVVSTR